jgi:hypothetical protein
VADDEEFGIDTLHEIAEDVENVAVVVVVVIGPVDDDNLRFAPFEASPAPEPLLASPTLG